MRRQSVPIARIVTVYTSRPAKYGEGYPPPRLLHTADRR